MISDDLIIYLLFQVILLMINIIGFTKIPYLSIFGIVGTIIITVPTMEGFGTYYLIALILILINISLPIFSLDRTRKRE